MKAKRESHGVKSGKRWSAIGGWVGLGLALIAFTPSTSRAGSAYTAATFEDLGTDYRVRGTFAGFRARTGAGANDYATFSSLKVAGFSAEVAFDVKFNGIRYLCSVPTSVPSAMINAMITGSSTGSNRWFEVRWNKDAGSCDRIWIEGGSPY
jgi:hypothetical protein